MKTDSISEDINNSLSLSIIYYLHPSDGIGAERYCGGELHFYFILFFNMLYGL